MLAGYARGVADAPAQGELRPGDVLGGYRVEALLGEGAMGSVYRAHAEVRDEPVALKVIKREHAGDAQHRQRFLHEARAAAAVVHPHLINVVDAGEIDGRQYLAMELVSGESLDRRIADGGPLSPHALASVAAEIGAGLDALHAAGLVHRDIKPGNILLRGEGEGGAALTDFGLAKGTDYADLTADGQIVGSLDYLAPERVRGEQATAASDMYSFGCVLYEALTGHPPFGGRGMVKTLFGHLEDTPADPLVAAPDTPRPFAAALLTALAKGPAERPRSGEAYAAALAAGLA